MSFSVLPSTPEPRRRSAGRPSRDDAEALPARILASARALFLDRGFAFTTVTDIASHAGVTKRTIYVKLGDKDALFAAVVSELLVPWREVVAPVVAVPRLQDRFEQVGHRLLAVMLEPEMVQLNRILLSETFRSPAMLKLLVAQVERGPIPQLARFLMMARGDTGTPGRHDEVAARLFYDMIVGAPLRVALTGRLPAFELSHAEWVRHAVGVFLHGWQHEAGAQT